MSKFKRNPDVGREISLDGRCSPLADRSHKKKGEPGARTGEVAEWALVTPSLSRCRAGGFSLSGSRNAIANYSLSWQTLDLGPKAAKWAVVTP